MDERLLEIKEYLGEGFKPLIYFGDWRVAILRWLESIEPEKIESLERHTQTDEVFILTQGQATLILGGNAPTVDSVTMQVMQPGKVYNVRQNTWHSVTLSRDASVLIVEDRDTGNENSEFCNLTRQQKQAIIGFCKGK